MIVVLAGLVAADWWIFFHVGVAQALRQVIYHPGLFLPLLAAVTLSAAFHEIGHASACRYGGARPGRMGCGLYLAWPAFYTDVSDAYRLGRRGRLRTDLGGVYFNVVIILICTAVYLANGNLEALLLLIVIEHMEIAHQLLPVIRLDGYYIVADLTGVPDLFARIGPIVRSLAFWRGTDPQVTPLKRWVRAAVTAWVLVVVPLLILELVIVLIHLPRILATSWDSAKQLTRGSNRAFRAGRVLEGLSDAVQILVLAIPIAGILLMIEQLFRKGSAWAWRATCRRPARRALAVAAGGAIVLALAFTWLPGRNYTPIQPGERGTEGEGIHALLGAVGGAGPLVQRPGGQPKGSGGRRLLHTAGPEWTPARTEPRRPANAAWAGCARLATTLASPERAASHRPSLERAASHRPIQTRPATAHRSSSIPAATDPSSGGGTGPSATHPPSTNAPRTATPITGFGLGPIYRKGMTEAAGRISFDPSARRM